MMVVYILGFLGLQILFKMVVLPGISPVAKTSFLHFTKIFGKSAETWGLPGTEEEALRFVERWCGYCLVTCTNIYIIVIGLKFLTRSSFNVIAWLVILYTYGARMLVY